MEKNINTGLSRRWLVAGTMGVVLLSSLCTAVGFFAGFSVIQDSPAPVVLKADSASRGKGISFATGFIGRDIEGIFVLDHLTGDLQCWILNPNTGEIGGIFRANVSNDLGSTKAADADYVIVAGRIDVTGQGRVGNMRPGASICYVGDGNTGKVVAYGLQYDPQAINRGDGVQEGELRVVAAGLSRGQAERDQ